MAIKYTKHAKEMLVLRRIKQEMVDETVNNPDETSPSREGKKIYLKDFGKNYLMLVVSEEMDDKIIITLHWLACQKKSKKGKMNL